MSDDKIIRNPARASLNEAPAPYVPNYKQLNIEPIGAEPIGGQSQHRFVKDSHGTSLIAKIGFSSVDGIDFDENDIVPVQNGEVIDNNDYVNLDFEQTDFQNEPHLEDPNHDEAEFALHQEEYSSHKEEVLAVGEYILMVNGKIIASGPTEVIENNVTKLMYGEHPMFKNAIDESDIIVLKRVGIKFGVFLKE